MASVGKKASGIAALAAAKTPAERQAQALSAKLRARSAGVLLTPDAETRAPSGSALRRAVPDGLRLSDGSDIVKKNAARKKKYLFAFPGGVALPPASHVGTLAGLDTPNPTLEIAYPAGRLRLRGTLVFPKNALLTLKGAATRGKPVRCTDAFETIVLWAEWAWLGELASNPGDVAKPLPPSMRSADGHTVWTTRKRDGSHGHPRAPAVTGVGSNDFDEPDDDDSDVDEESVDADDDAPLMHGTSRRKVKASSDDDEILGQWNPLKAAPARSQPARASRASFAGMFEDDGVDDGEEEDDDELEIDGDEAINEEDGNNVEVHDGGSDEIGEASAVPAVRVTRNRSARRASSLQPIKVVDVNSDGENDNDDSGQDDHDGMVSLDEEEEDDDDVWSR
jgi:hypothetical protein